MISNKIPGYTLEKPCLDSIDRHAYLSGNFSHIDQLGDPGIQKPLKISQIADITDLPDIPFQACLNVSRQPQAFNPFGLYNKYFNTIQQKNRLHNSKVLNIVSYEYNNAIPPDAASLRRGPALLDRRIREVIMSEWDSETADWYAEKYGEYPTNRLAVEKLVFVDDTTIVDVGCGTGAAYVMPLQELEVESLSELTPFPE